MAPLGEVAFFGIVAAAAENASGLGVLLDLGVDVGLIGGGEHESPGFAGHVCRGVGRLDAIDGEVHEGGYELWADDGDVCAGWKEALGFSQCDCAAADDEDGGGDAGREKWGKGGVAA